MFRIDFEQKTDSTAQTIFCRLFETMSIDKHFKVIVATHREDRIRIYECNDKPLRIVTVVPNT